MSFSDVAQHLIDSDRWLIKTLSDKVSSRLVGRFHLATAKDRTDFESLLDALIRSGEQRSLAIEGLTHGDLEDEIEAPELGG